MASTGSLEIRKARHQDFGRIGRDVLYLRQQFNAAHARHFLIRNNYCYVFLL